MRRALPLAICLAALALPTVAAAKEVSKVSVCGTGHCTTYDKSDKVNLMLFVEDAGPTNPPAQASAWYRVKVTVDVPEEAGDVNNSWTTAYVPAAGKLRLGDGRGGYQWVGVNPEARRALDRAVRGIEGFAPARLKGLEATLPEAQVDTVVLPPQDPPPPSGDDGTPWGWIAAAIVAAAGAALMLARRLRRRPGATGPSPA